jgi:hypothetical protein
MRKWHEQSVMVSLKTTGDEALVLRNISRTPQVLGLCSSVVMLSIRTTMQQTDLRRTEVLAPH